ncbi:MAG: imidazoleglycerol-phosphate dehydratase HisB [Candidatus Izimaplasma sp.]|nr:imidazoleglycerol-phosphate dehydratase HisB [Candidatus Izimaplasma bacterium]
MREATYSRNTTETKIDLTLSLDGNQKIMVDTPIPFLNHLLDLMAFYAGFDLSITATGDTEIDDHHLVEDIGILLGKSVNKALGNKQSITRFSAVYIPMDESLSRIVVDVSGRPYLMYNATYKRDVIGSLSLENINEFLYAFTMNSKLTLHVENLYGKNDHHKAESIFKGLGRALKKAFKETNNKAVPSTKGLIE